MGKSYTKIELKTLRKNYPNIGSIGCSKLLNKSIKSIQMMAFKYKIKANTSKIFLNLRKDKPKKVNETQFFEVSNPKIAYILGLIWADGHIRIKQNHHTIRANLITSDAKNIKNIFLSIGNWSIYDYDSRKSNEKPQTTITTNNRPLALYLKKLNYCSKNLSACKILKTIPNKLKKYWWRGYFDGDGCLYINKETRHNQLSFSAPINQNWDFAEKLFNKFKIIYGKNKFIRTNNKNKINKHSIVRISNYKDIYKFLNYIYDINYEFGLKRKYKKAKEFIEWRNFLPIQCM